MPLIGRVGRRHRRVRMLIAGIYALLIAGGITMIYPFLLMLAGSTKTSVDVRETRLIPSFLVSEAALYRKHVEGLFNEQLDVMRAVYDLNVPTFEDVPVPDWEAAGPAELEDWGTFLASGSLSPKAWTAGYVYAPVSRTTPRLLRSFKQWLQEQHGADIAAVNRALGTEFTGWNAVYVIPEDWTSRRQPVSLSDLQQAFQGFKTTVPDLYRVVFSVEGAFRRQYLMLQYGRDISGYNEVHGTTYTSYREIPFPTSYPAEAPESIRTDWERFVRDGLNLHWVRFSAGATEGWRDYLEARYGTVAAFARKHRTSATTWGEVAVPEAAPDGGIALTDWESFLVGWKDPDSGVLHQAAPGHLRVASPEQAYREYLREAYGSLSALNQVWGTGHEQWDTISPPHAAWHYAGFADRLGEVRWGFVASNYAAVWDYLATHGRGLINTVIYCTLAVLAALIVNPMAAYALSRFKLRRTYTILLVLLLTMAFPPMVTQIPVFLMMRDIHLLNTFAALILPGLAHGYSIFLLKGFFDSLPRDLYESASLDGAGEWTMFWHITMSLSKPILAVIALQAFNLAYSNFMFALLICQDERMWTLMVWLYQLQMRSGPGVMYASLILASLPMLAIFVFCQNIIMRGIVVPVEK